MSNPRLIDDKDVGPSDLEVGPLLDKRADSGEIERPLEPAPASSPPPSTRKLSFWITVFTNKLLLSSSLLRHIQLLFAAYHFALTHLTLHICSTPRLSLFPRASAPLSSLLPISLAMTLNVLLPNLSLAHSSITFYQTVRVLLTPCTVLLNYLFYARTISLPSTLALLPICLGVALVTYTDVHTAPSSRLRLFPSASDPRTTTTPLGALFALAGVLASSIYTLLIASQTTRLNMSSIQLLHRQSLPASLLLLWAVPWLDDLPPLSAISRHQWFLVAVSGACAVLINLSQFAIVAGAGAVASTVVGHAKTIGVVGLGWWAQVRGWREGGLLGVMLAIGGIVGYTVAEGRERRRGGGKV
ncbi:hypothetical protein CAC42_822 [Sphaceloma murrayae]|uniref:Sugar phosphate transporter domain-containing protein n=1 Tax=Sphaceloma murrayae TaxID=2082308 RepID=A0A2K1QL73_9PEZI|nr:hypothetical protein CAC42_822 [Sphaceloma murrayae]